MTDPLVCDFCSAPDVRWRCPVTGDFPFKTEHASTVVLRPDGRLDVIEMGLAGGSVGDWAACPACRALIVRGDRERLARRSAKRMVKNNPLPLVYSDILVVVRRRHDEFWSHRSGPPIPEERTP